MKRCSKCGLDLEQKMFSNNKGRHDGLAVYCRACSKIYYSNREDKTAVARTRKWQKANPEKHLQTQTAYKENNKEKIAAKLKDYRLKHPEVRENYRKANAEKIAAQVREYQIAHPELGAIASSRRRAKIKNNGIYKVTQKDAKKMLEKPCLYCGAKSEHLDHIIPIHRGGTHSIGNLIGACGYCNRSKSDKFITEWKKKQQTKEDKSWQ